MEDKGLWESRRTSPVALHTVSVINRAMQVPEAQGEFAASKNYQDIVSNKQDLLFIALSYSILLGNLRCGEDVLRYQRRSRHLPTRPERREWKSCSLIFLPLKVSSAWYQPIVAPAFLAQWWEGVICLLFLPLPSCCHKWLQKSSSVHMCYSSWG